MFIRNVGSNKAHTVSHPRRQHSSCTIIIPEVFASGRLQWMLYWELYKLLMNPKVHLRGDVLLTSKGVWGARMEPICPNMTQAPSKECRSCVGNSSALYTYITVYEMVMANFPAKKSSRRAQSRPVTHRDLHLLWQTARTHRVFPAELRAAQMNSEFSAFYEVHKLVNRLDKPSSFGVMWYALQMPGKFSFM
jgi:hypothetical protein